MRLLITCALLTLLPPPPAVAEPIAIMEAAAVQSPPTRPRPRPSDARCTADGEHCIRLSAYVEDTCGVVAAAAALHGLDPGFFARLLWRESLFDATAVSPVGAQGIAQFMPGTAKLRGLKDPFNPAEAILASAHYLKDLNARFGNPGLAAAAYNSGEARTSDFVSSGRILPGETRAYVRAITGHSATRWRDDPPGEVDYRLAPDRPFLEACTAQAASRAIRQFRDPRPPWGVIIAAGRREAVVAKFANDVMRANRHILGRRKMVIVNSKVAGFGVRGRLTAQIATATKAEALGLCRRLRSAGAYCRLTQND